MAIKDKLKWNEKYRQRLKTERPDLGKPNERLTLFHKYFHGNNALDIACGLGANSFYLAKLGYHVQAVDISDIAIQHINQVAKQFNLTVEGKVIDLEESSLPQATFDLVINTLYLERNLFKAMQEALKPGGYLFIETYYLVEEEDPNPRIRQEFKLYPQELLNVFREMKIIYYDENKETGLATFFAQKKY